MSKLRDLAVEIGLEEPEVELTLEDIKAGILRYYEETGKVPRTNSGGSSRYVPNTTTWGSLATWLKRSKNTSLQTLVFELGLIVCEYHTSIPLENIKKGMLKYYEQTGKAPTDRSGDSSDFIPNSKNWRAIHSRLRLMGTTLRRLAVELGIAVSWHPEFTLEDVRNGIQRFFLETESLPSQGTGSSSKYIYGSKTWKGVDRELRRRGTSLVQLKAEMFPVEEVSIQSIRAGILQYWQQTGWFPTSGPEESFSYIAGTKTWGGINGRLKRFGYSLSGLVQEMQGVELPENNPRQISVDEITEGVRKYYAEHGRTPSMLAGDSSLYVSRSKTWNGINGRLINLGTTLAKVCTELYPDEDVTLDRVRLGILSFYKDTGDLPNTVSGDSSEYIRGSTSWESTDKLYCMRNSGMSLAKLKRQLIDEGLLPQDALDHKYPYSLEDVKSGILEFHRVKGARPATESGDASSYIPGAGGWGSVQNRLNKEGLSLAALAEELGLTVTLADIHKGIRQYHKEQGKAPAACSGDSSLYIPGTNTWSTVSGMCQRLGGEPLRDMTVSMGLGKPYFKKYTLEQVRAGISKYFEETGEVPKPSPQSAAGYILSADTWQSVNQKLRDQHETSLRMLSLEMGLMKQIPLSEKYIRKEVLQFYGEHGFVPTNRHTLSDGRGYPAVDCYLRKQGSSLKLLRQQMMQEGLLPLEALHKFTLSTNSIREAILKFYECKHRTPKSKDRADAFLPGSTTWSVVSAALCRRGIVLTSLIREVLLEKYPDLEATSLPIDPEDIQTGILKYHRETGRVPICSKEPSSRYVAGSSYWRNLDRRLRNAGSSLLQTAQQLVDQGTLPPEALRRKPRKPS